MGMRTTLTRTPMPKPQKRVSKKRYPAEDECKPKGRRHLTTMLTARRHNSIEEPLQWSKQTCTNALIAAALHDEPLGEVVIDDS